MVNATRRPTIKTEDKTHKSMKEVDPEPLRHLLHTKENLSAEVPTTLMVPEEVLRLLHHTTAGAQIRRKEAQKDLQSPRQVIKTTEEVEVLHQQPKTVEGPRRVNPPGPQTQKMRNPDLPIDDLEVKVVAEGSIFLV